MSKLPEFLIPYRKTAERFILKRCLKEIEFSGSTYQAQIIDDATNEESWAFLQLDPKGRIKDCFCSCKTEEGLAACAHIATTFLYIFNNQSLPLHQRFNRSLWNQLCKIFADHIGTSTSLLHHPSPEVYLYESAEENISFKIKTTEKSSQLHLQDLIKHRLKETEETSIKFSGLTQEEIALWKEGRPSSQLRYELSFWNDLAKWLMFEQEQQKPYQIHFDFSKEQVPNQIHIRFPTFEVDFSLLEADLPSIIPSLSTVECPLHVHTNYEDSIAKITYDKINTALHVELKENDTEMQREINSIPNGAILIGNWFFIPGDGFYPREAHILASTPLIKGKDIPAALSEHYKVIEHLIQGTVIHEDPIKVSYEIHFDKNWNLHISCYLYEPGDLSKPYSCFFGEWAYLDNDGFYHLTDVFSKNAELIVPSKEVSDFVSRNRMWLNMQEGFSTHLVNIENKLSYFLREDGCLIFESQIVFSEETEQYKDFGPWVYVHNQGFFSKINPAYPSPIHPGTIVEPEAIPLFIKVNRDELHAIPNFFSSQCPVVKTGLKFEINNDESICITPTHELLPEYATASIRFFGDVVFIPGKGFSELPAELRLPEAYRNPIQIDPENTDYFFEQDFEGIKKYATLLDPRLCSPKVLSLVAESIEEKSDNAKGWEALKMSYQSEFGKVTVAHVWREISQHKNFFLTEAGLINLKDERFNWLRLLKKQRINIKSNLMKLSTMEILRLDAFDEIHPPDPGTKHGNRTNLLLKQIKGFITPDQPDLKGLQSHLRPYQKLGVNWLWFLYHHNLSGLLCDDMGLGKTHQAMALLASVMNSHKKDPKSRPHHFLVICPTSVIFHWQEKLQTFLPSARVCIFHGIKRSLEDFHKDYDILLTSYGIWRNDNQLLKHVFFEVAIFDEIQLAKNWNSQVYSALLQAQTAIRIGLTGTPIENRLRELKAVFDIVLPHYMPGETEYRELFIKPIEKQNDIQKKKLLSRFIKPFVLRRKKEDVLNDLPEKIEEIAHCPLLPQQQRLYQDVLQQARPSLLDKLQNVHSPIPYIHIFSLLSALKQICNHPAVYYKQPENYKHFQSGKWELFIELLNEARESQQKVVIFSQYLTMLDIIEAYLSENNIGFAAIRGATVDRGQQVASFNKDPRCEVFVGSLLAAGLGIDLTAGSVVIHYDRWWNAAKENQATDRVHRIGQKKGVQVFKLVTKGTFEERIDTLIAQKGKLMEDIVSVDEQQYLKKFDRNEIINLLQEMDLSGENAYDEMC